MPVPPEVVLEIVDNLASDSFSLKDLQLTTACYRKLCLTSRWFYQVAFPLLYQDVCIPTLPRVERFLRTVESSDWVGKKWRGEVKGLVKTLTFGCGPRRHKKGAFDLERDGRLLERVLRTLDRPAIRVLALEACALATFSLIPLYGQSRDCYHCNHRLRSGSTG